MDAGGVEVGILDICKKVKDTKDFNIFILSNGGKLINKAVFYGAKFIKLNVKSKNPITVYKNIKKIEKVISENKINIVEVESRAPAWSAYHACKNLKVPFITTIHGAYGVQNIFKRLYNSIMLKGDVVIAVSNFIKDYCCKNYKNFLKSRKDNIVVIHRGIDTNIFNIENINKGRMVLMQERLQLPDNKIIITMPARMTPIKGQDYLLEALNLIENKNFYCVLAGENSKHKKYRKKIEKIIYKNNMGSFVKICDNIMDMQSLYAISDIVISATQKPESFGLVSIETQAMKKIFIGTALGGTLETIKDGETGFLAPYNSKEYFANIIEKTINLSQDEKNKIGGIARENVYENFTFDLFYEKIKNLYNNLNTI